MDSRYRIVVSDLLLSPDHANALAGAKRPYHTIIPGILTYADTNELYATLSNMGGNMQPQGHLQLTVDMVAGGMDPQAAVDKARFCIASGTQDGVVQLEEGVSETTVKELKSTRTCSTREYIRTCAKYLWSSSNHQEGP